MSAESHLTELAEKHKRLEERITKELAFPASDAAKIARWKHEKLRLKEEIERVRMTIH